MHYVILIVFALMLILALLAGAIFAFMACIFPLLGALLIHTLVGCLVGFVTSRNISLRELVTEDHSNGVPYWSPVHEHIRRAYMQDVALWGATILSAIWLLCFAPWIAQRTEELMQPVASDIVPAGFIAAILICLGALFGMQKLMAPAYSQFWFGLVERKVRKANEQLGKVANLHAFECQNRELAAKLSTGFSIDYSSQAEDFVARNHDSLPTSPELRSELEDIVSRWEQTAASERSELERAFSAHEQTVAIFETATPKITQSALRVLALRFDQLMNDAGSEELFELISDRRFAEFHQRINQIQSEIRDLERSAEDGPSAEHATNGAPTASGGSKSCYEILDLDPSATKQDIEKRVQRLRAVYHPDQYPKGSRESIRAKKKFDLILEAADKLLR